MKSLNPYLTFNGNCEEAFNFYKSVFGGEFSMLMRFEDAPAEMKKDASAEDMQKIIHIELPLTENIMLMGSDLQPGGGRESAPHSLVNLIPDDKAETDAVFNKLSAGGQTIMPPGDVFWGTYFGMLEDKFGVQWMLNYYGKES